MVRNHVRLLRDLFIFGPKQEFRFLHARLCYTPFPFILLVSAIAVRFMLLPRFKSLGKVLQIFIIGLSLAESAGFMATFLLSADDARTCFVATLTVLLMYAPFFANKLETD